MDDLKDTTSTRVSKAMRSLPRDHFIEMSDPSVVLGRSIPPTNAVSEILHHARVCPEHKVLQIGTGAGYVAALLSKLAAQVVTIEINPSISRFAQSRFNKLGLANLVLREQDGSEGAPDLGPYDRIMVSSPRIKNTQRLLEQLASGGLLIALEQGENNTHILTRYEVSELGATLRRELALVDFSKDTGMTLLDLGMVDQVMLSEARRLARRKKLPVIKVLRDKLNMEDATLYRRLAEENGMTFSPVDELLPRVQPQLMEVFSRSFLDSHHIIPLEISERNLLVATDDPDSSVEDILRMHPYDRVVKVLVTPNDFKRLWTTVELSLQGDAKKLWGAVAESAEKDEEGDLLSREKTRIEAHLITLCDALLLDAISEGASDLHIEQYKERTRIRLRVDGDLHDINHYELSPLETRGLVNVIKIRGEMDIAEKRLPQGGRSQLTAGGIGYDLRIQIQPSLHGEAVVIRMLPQSGNIVAIEDPIEYSMEDIQQTWTRPEIGFSFADGMRSFVRLDPDVILVGEIRDTETALEAIRASQTGHVVLSTLHSNDAVDALQRIYDLNVHANSVASELMAVIAQKLAKRICPDCKTEATPDPAILEELFPEGTPDSFRCYQGKGCETCSGRGTKGRVAVVEYMQVNSEIRNAIALRVPVAELRSIALDSGLTTMRDSGLNHVLEGAIPITELPRILPADRMAPEKRGTW
jgi:type IV pilus assembly protein PilB